MRKFSIAGLLALSALAGSQQPASAWVNARFGIGLDFSWQSGGNNLLWGLWSNGQVPGPWGNGLGGLSHAGYAPPPVMPAYPMLGYGAPSYYSYPVASTMPLMPLTPPTPLPDFPNNFWFYP
jgi:hypothetical protein